MSPGRIRLDRRNFLTQVLPATAFTLGIPPSFAATETGDIIATPLAEGLALLTGAGGNVVLLHSAEGALLVDGGTEARSEALLKKVAEISGHTRVHTLFNTHWHASQTGSNRRLGAAGTRIIAHENTRLWLSTDVDCKWEQRTYLPQPREAQPNQTFYTTGKLSFGGEDIEYGLLPQAHTDGDIYVHFRKANVLVGGDVLATGAFPIIDYCTNGWIGGLQAAVQTLMDLGNVETRYVPGIGMPQRLPHLQAEHAMLTEMRTRLAKLLAQGMSVREMIAARPAEDFEAQWGDPNLFIANAWPGMVYRARELGVSIV